MTLDNKKRATPPSGKKIAVWADRASGCVCIAVRPEGHDAGKDLPEENIRRVPITDIEEFLGSVFEWITQMGITEAAVFSGVLRCLDSTAAGYAGTAERIREQLRKDSGGLAPNAQIKSEVETLELVRLREQARFWYAVEQHYPDLAEKARGLSMGAPPDPEDKVETIEKASGEQGPGC